MTYVVPVRDVIPQYHAYAVHSAMQEHGNNPIWQVNHDQNAFENKWFTEKGIGLMKVGSIHVKLVFDDRERFMEWLLRWS